MPRRVNVEKNNSKKGNHAVWRKFAYVSLSWLLALQFTGALKVSSSRGEESQSLLAPELWEIKGIMTAFEDGDFRVWVEALNQLSRYELDELKSAEALNIDLSNVAKLLQYKENVMLRTAAAKALGEMGELAKEHAPKLVELLEDPDWRVRLAAAEALGKMGEAAKEQAPKLGELLAHSDSNIRWVAAKALEGMGKAAQGQAPKLVEMLKDPDWRSRGAAAKALGSMQEAAKQQAPKLVELLKDSDWRVRRAAAEALGGMGKAAKEQASTLGGLLKDSDWRVRRAAVEALGGMGEEARGQIPKLGGLLKDSDSSVRRAAAAALGEMGGLAKEQAPKLVEALKDNDSSVSWAAAQALGRMGEAAKEELPRVEELLIDPESRIRWAAAHALGHMGEAAQVEAPKLVELLKDPDWSVRIAAAEALGRMGPAAQAEAPKLVELLKDPDTNVRLVAAEALARIGEAAKKHYPQPAELLRDSDNNVRKGAAEILGRMGTASTGQAPKLAQLLQDSDNNVKRAAAQALGEMGEGAKEQAPRLARLLKDSDDDVKRAAAQALGRIGQTAKKYAPQLVELLKDPNKEVRRAAAEALKEMGPIRDLKITSRILDVIYQYPSETTTLRFLIYFVTGAEPNSINLLEWLGSPKKYPEQLSHKEGVEVLDSFAKAWEPSKSFLRLRIDLEKQIAVVIDRVSWKTENRLLLQQHYNNLKSVDSNHTDEIEDIMVALERWHRVFLASEIWLGHFFFWLILILAYPKSPRIRSIFFWNPWVRRILGLGYIDLVLSEIPWLRSRLFTPFRSSLVTDADLESFDSQAYFAQSRVKNENTGQIQLLIDAIGKIKGQIILQGESGNGKSMFLRYLAKNSQRPIVYLRANKCDRGVIEAISTKLPELLQDSAFLRRLLQKGGLDICLDGLNETSANTRTKITEFIESDFQGNIVIATQKLQWQLSGKASTYILQPLQQEEIEEFLRSRQAILPANAPVKGEDYQKACSAYLAEVLREQSEAALNAAKLILSNPMDSSTIAITLASQEKPDLFYLQKQQYHLMAKEYQKLHFREFPLSRFGDRVYQMRLNDEEAIPEAEFFDELQCLERHQMVVCHQSLDAEGNSIEEWQFCHSKIMDYFIAQTFLKKEIEEQSQHFDDSRFRGVYLLLATLMPLNSAMELREQLIQYAADTKDHSVSDTFIQLLRTRKTVSLVGSKMAIF